MRYFSRLTESMKNVNCVVDQELPNKVIEEKDLKL